MNAHDYFAQAKLILDQAKTTQASALVSMAQAMGDVMIDNGLIQLLGIGPDRAFAMELGYRAGGLMPYHQVNLKDLVLRGHVPAEDMKDPHFADRSDLAEPLWHLYNIQPQDALLIYAAANVSGVALGVAKLAKAEKRKIFFVGNIKSVTRSQNGRELIALSDLTLDLCTPVDDTILPLEGDIMITQVANVVGNIFAQMLTAETYRYLKDKGLEAPVLLSANVTGADVHNRKISDVYLGRWNS